MNLPREEYESVVSHPVNLDLMETEAILSVFDINGDHEIRTCYGDICKTVNALRDYSKILVMVCNTWGLHGFHRVKYEFHAEKLREIADKLQAGIGYDYDTAVEQCEKKKSRKQRDDDVGGEAMAMGILKAQQMAESKARKTAKMNGTAGYERADRSLIGPPWGQDEQ